MAPDAFLGQFSAGRLALEAYVTTVYVAVLSRMAWRTFVERAEPAIPSRFLVAWGVVVLARIGPSLDPSIRLRQWTGVGPPASMLGNAAAHALNALVALLATALFWAVLRRAAPTPLRREVDGFALHVGAWIVGLAALLAAIPLLGLALGVEDPASTGVYLSVYQFGLASIFSLRWFAFALLAGPAFLRNQVFDLDLRLRRLLLAGTAAGVFLVAFVVGMTLLEQRVVAESGLGLGSVLALAFLGLAASQSVRWGRRLADRFFPPQEARLEELRRIRRYEIYRDAARAVSAGNLARHDLEALGARLGLDEGERRAALATALPGTRQPRGPGDVVAGRYELVRVIGQGGHGRVFEALDRREGSHVALKELDLGDARSIGLVEREVLAGKALDHPRVARAKDFVAVDGFVGVVSELVRGPSLLGELRARGPLDPVRARRLLADLLDALAFAHERGVIHRDVKPGNVLLDEGGRARLADFGIAFVPDAEITVDASVAVAPGTRGFLPPEAFHGGAPTPAWDVFAAARTFVEAIGGPGALAQVSDAERLVVARALSDDPAVRYRDARAFLQAWAGAEAPRAQQPI